METEQTQHQITVVYKPLKGLAEFARLTLAAIGEPWNDVIQHGGDPWFQKAPALHKQGFDFPNIPYIIDGDFYLSESQTIGIYLCERFNRLDLIGGENLQARARVIEMIGVLQETRMLIVHPTIASMTNPDFKTLLAEASNEASKLRRKLHYLSSYLGEDNWFVNNNFTLADIHSAFCLHIISSVLHSAGLEDVINNYPNLVAHRARVWKQPGIQEHCASELWKKPIFTPEAIPWVREEY